MLVLASAAWLAAGCEFVRETTNLPKPTPETPPGNGSSMLGTWQSHSTTPQVDSSTCGQFKWIITSESPTMVTGTFTATCLGNVPFSGSGIGQRTTANTFDIAVTGSAVIQGVNCQATITATATIHDDLATIPYTGQTCLGPISGVEHLRRPGLSKPPPAPPPTPSQVKCASLDAHALVACMSKTYPERLVAGVTINQRRENMAWLRDRIIEAGKCGGLDLGWNLPRGGPEIGLDSVAQRLGGQLLGISIAIAFEDVSSPLRLQWALGSSTTTYLTFPWPQC
jgi:hypothetical protein